MDNKESHNFDHEHDHQNAAVSYRDILIALFLNLGFAIAELLVFFATNSITMYSSALHDFGDAIILFFTSRIEKISNKKRNKKYTYGNRRFSLIGALINAVILLLSSIFIIKSAIGRLITPEEVEIGIVLVMAIFGMIINFTAKTILGRNKSFVSRALVLNFKADFYNYIAIFISAILIYFFDLYFIDSLFSIFIAIKMLIEVIKELRIVFEMLMQAVPRNIDIEVIEKLIKSNEFVYDVHDIHIWNLDGQDYIMSFHIIIDFNKYDIEQVMMFKEQLKLQLEEQKINHTTIEIDTIEYGCRLEHRHEHYLSDPQ